MNFLWTFMKYYESQHFLHQDAKEKSKGLSTVASYPLCSLCDIYK